MASYATTNHSGAFTLTDVEPGTYVLLAQSSKGPPDEHLAYATTYYPSSDFRAGGAKIVVGPGAELFGAVYAQCPRGACVAAWSHPTAIQHPERPP